MWLFKDPVLNLAFIRIVVTNDCCQTSIQNIFHGNRFQSSCRRSAVLLVCEEVAVSIPELQELSFDDAGKERPHQGVIWGQFRQTSGEGINVGWGGMVGFH